MKAMRIIVLTWLIVGFLPLTGWTQVSRTEAVHRDDTPYIEVTGTAEKEIVPDQIFIRIVLKERFVDRVKVTIEEQETKLKAALQTIGIPLSELTISDVNAGYIRIRWQKKDLLAQSEYTLKVTNATEVGKVFLELDKLNIQDASIARVDHTQMDAFRREVKIMAIKAARDKAQYLLEAIGEQPGEPLIIYEIDQPGISRNAMENVSIGDGYFDKASVGKVGTIEFEKIRLQSSIYIKYQIKN